MRGESREIGCAVKDGSGLQPLYIRPADYLGRCPRLVWSGPLALDSVRNIYVEFPPRLHEVGMEWSFGPFSGMNLKFKRVVAGSIPFCQICSSTEM